LFAPIELNNLNEPTVDESAESVIINQSNRGVEQQINDLGIDNLEAGPVSQAATVLGARSEPRIAVPKTRLDAECLAIGSYSGTETFREGLKVISKLESFHGGREKEIEGITELLAKDRYKELVSMTSFPVRGSGKVVRMWVDDEKVSHSKEFYITLMTDFLTQCKTPAAVIWYSGHGEDATGNWCFRDGTVCLREVFELYQTHFKHKILSIVSDCSYSGCWVQDMAGMLDNMGIPPCGHYLQEQGMLLKVFTSCHSHQQTCFLKFVDHVLVVGNDGIIRMFPKKCRATQNRLYLDLSDIVCPSTDLNVCKLHQDAKYVDSKWKTWRNRAKNLAPLIFLVRGKDRGKPAWHYVLVEPGKVNIFKDKVASGTVDSAKFGEILLSGWGKDPPEDVKSAMKFFD
jgi:hypothetical protein